MSAKVASTEQIFANDAWAEKMAAVVARSAHQLDDPAISIARLDAEPLLIALRSILAAELEGSNERKLDLLDAEASWNVCDSQSFVIAHDCILELGNRAALGAMQSMLFIQKKWGKTPSYHVDASAFTIVFPLRSAPTFYILDKLVRSPDSAGFAADLPLDTILHSEIMPQSAITAAENEIVFMKGAAWSGSDNALVHSPPYQVTCDSLLPALASAIILEFRSRPPIFHG